MGLVKVSTTGSFDGTKSFLRKAGITNEKVKIIADKYGKIGVDALRDATPKKTGLTSESWGYIVEVSKNTLRVIWTNTNNNHGVNIVLLLQYGHATRNGGYVMGRDFINPAIQPIFDKLADDAWMEVISNE